LSAPGRGDRGAKLRVLLLAVGDPAVELVDLGFRLLQLERPPVVEQDDSQDHGGDGERHEERDERPGILRRLRRSSHDRENAAPPAKTPAGPRSSSISSRRLYLARRSPRHAEPVLIRPALTATERSAIESSEVSPERW